MSISTSLHIWSSIKIPYSGYDGRKVAKGKIKSNAPYLDPSSNTPQVPDPGNIASLPVPDPLRKGSDAIPIVKKKKMPRKSVAHVTVPDILELNSGNDIEIFKDEFNETNANSQEFTGRFEFDDKELHGVPFLKPWTAKELEEVNNRFTLLEEEREKRRKRKQNLSLKQEMKVTQPPTSVTSGPEGREAVSKTSKEDLKPERKRTTAADYLQDSFSVIARLRRGENKIPTSIFIIVFILIIFIIFYYRFVNFI